ncbi:hypothetical protein BD309DRAFT_954631 [Dichomitus squalens]|nr:hypothetical protein BD309DRAFT_954631 [Dichomitus squalens]
MILTVALSSLLPRLYTLTGSRVICPCCSPIPLLQDTTVRFPLSSIVLRWIVDDRLDTCQRFDNLCFPRSLSDRVKRTKEPN